MCIYIYIHIYIHTSTSTYLGNLFRSRWCFCIAEKKVQLLGSSPGRPVETRGPGGILEGIGRH